MTKRRSGNPHPVFQSLEELRLTDAPTSAAFFYLADDWRARCVDIHRSIGELLSVHLEPTRPFRPEEKPLE